MIPVFVIQWQEHHQSPHSDSTTIMYSITPIAFTPFLYFQRKKWDFIEEERKAISNHFFFLFFIFFLQRTLESLNDRLFEAGKTFKDNQFQLCHLALVVIRDWHIYMQWKEKLGLGIRNPRSSAGSGSLATIGWSLNLFTCPQLWKGMVITVSHR